MSVEEFHAIPDGIRAEYVDGVAIVSPPAKWGHNKVQRRIANQIEAALPALDVGHDAGLKESPSRFRIPDIAAFVAQQDDVVWSDQVPVLVVEVLSPSTRREDLVRKSHEYVQLGIEQYWVVDHEAWSLTVYAGSGGKSWGTLLELNPERPRGEVRVGDYGTVTLDLDALFSA